MLANGAYNLYIQAGEELGLCYCSWWEPTRTRAALFKIACSPYTVFFRPFEVRWYVLESPLYHHVEGSLLYKNPLSVNLAKVSFYRDTT